MQNAYLAAGWWVNDTASEPPTDTLRIPYLALNGDHWEASVTQVKVEATGSIPAHLEPSLIHNRPDHPDQSWIGNTFSSVGASGETYTATLTPAPQNWPPLVKPAVSGTTFVEGDTISFRANASDPNDNPGTGADEDPLTIDWYIEAPDTPNIIASGNDGISSLDRCYMAPLAQTDATGHPITFACPWVHHTGAETTFRYIDDGNFHVHVIATDSHGARASQVFEVAIGNAPAVVTLSEPSSFTIDEAQSVDLAGQFTDPGDDPAKVVVDWGDGQTETQFFPCDWTAARCRPERLLFRLLRHRERPRVAGCGPIRVHLPPHLHR